MTLVLTEISKHFGSVVALDHVNLNVLPGRVHALLGENGAGKSTLLQIASGVTRPDHGTISIRTDHAAGGDYAGFTSPRQAQRLGIGTVHQHFTSIPAFTVAENIALTAGWSETGRSAERRAREVIARIGLPLDASSYVESLSVQQRQQLEIVKALATNARVLLLDEPTAVLAPREVDELLSFVREFVSRGGSAVLISHKLDEVLRSADDITVLRRGKVMLSAERTAVDAPSITHAMIGGDVPARTRQPVRRGERLAHVDTLSLRRIDSRSLAVVGATFELFAGEIVGVAAIDGNGQRELLRAVASVDQVEAVAGSVDVAGPVAFIPEDRTTEGLIGALSVTENFALSTLSDANRWMDWAGLRLRAITLMREFDIRADSVDQPVDALSGGNQQKLVLARALEQQPRVIVAENPTRGLDVSAAHAVHERLREAARRGAAVLVHSSDLDEVIELADRVLIVKQGKVIEPPRNASRSALGDLMVSASAPR